MNRVLRSALTPDPSPCLGRGEIALECNVPYLYARGGVTEGQSGGFRSRGEGARACLPTTEAPS
jgi:hypothetical protein